MEKKEPILKVRHLTTSLQIEGKIYKVVNDLSFDLFSGKTLALVGESGCGKSLTAFSILRILPSPPALLPTGEVFYDGKNILALSEKEMRDIRGLKIAMICQDPRGALNPVYTIGYQLCEVAMHHLNLSEEDAQKKALKALTDVYLPFPEKHMKEYPHQLSGGMLQRAMIAMALLLEPDILIADEPTTALDVTIQAQILALLKELQQKKGLALLLITHDMGIVAEMAHDVIVMYASEKVEIGNVEEIFYNPAHPYTQGLFESRATHSLKKGKLPTIRGSVPSITSFPKGCHFYPRCPYAMPLCEKESPPDFKTTSPSHAAKCWLFDEKLQEKLSYVEDS